MARGRMLNNKISASKQFDELPNDTCRLLATWTIAHLDMRGVFYGDPALVKSYVFPRRADVTIDDVANYLDIMANTKDGDGTPLIVLFEARGDTWQWWPQFAANQVGLRADRESTDFPAPPCDHIEEVPDDGGECAEDAPQDGGECAETGGIDDGNSPAEEKLSEGKENISEDNNAGKAASTASSGESRSPPTLSEGQKLWLQAFGAKRFRTIPQKNAVHEMEVKYGLETLQQGIQWAAKQGMAMGKAVVALETALPKWNNRNGSKKGETVTVKGL